MEGKPVNYVVENDRRRQYYKRQKFKKRKRIFIFFVLLLTVLGITMYGYTLIISPSDKAGKKQISTDTADDLNRNIMIYDQNINSTTGAEKKKIEEGKLQESTQEYDYAMPVPESPAVENSYFDDAVFIGDSRTEGLILNMGLSNTTSYTHKGLMVDTVFTKPVIHKNGAKLSVMEALKETAFTKVYIMLGINETGWPYNDVFVEKYGKIIDEIKNINSNAIIYVQEIMPVANSVSSSHSYIKNKKINEFNNLIIRMAEEKQIYYIDTVSPVVSSDGSLPEDAASDGIHLKKEYCKKWLECLKTHTITS